MPRHWYALTFTLGQTIGDFAKQFERLPQDVVIPWEALGGLFVNKDLVKDVDGSISIRLPLIVEEKESV